ncbi:MAG TPA: tryptophan synthase subunit alpha [Phaeodactylibacter sp.]|nr:tryptophan synthase subunit alpha [Phaeodactylibacter sp.]
MNRIQQLFDTKKQDICNIYFTAGFPNVDDTEKIILTLEKAGADMVEIGMPYSDPLADGPTIQHSGSIALKNGMTLPLLFEQIKSTRQKTAIPMVMMGYFNQVMQYGEEAFFQKCKEVGIDGLILPDLPAAIYESDYQALMNKYDLNNIFLITPQTSDERIEYLDKLSSGFIYMVADASVTGKQKDISNNQITYFQRIEKMGLQNHRLIGFGIADHQSFTTACQYSNGAIIGSAFIRALEKSEDLEKNIFDFMGMIKGE